MTETKGKLLWLDLAKGIGIVAVVLGHVGCTPYPGIVTIVYAFHMPLFFFICGFLFNIKKAEESFSNFIMGKFKRIIVPYFFSCLVLYFYWIYIWGMPAKQNLLNPLLGILYASGAKDSLIYNSALWFLPSYFCATLILYFIVKVSKNDIIFGVIMTVLIAVAGDTLVKVTKLSWNTPLGLDKAMIAAIFCYGGFLTRKYDFLKVRNRFFDLTISLVLFTVLFYCSGRNGNANIQYVNDLFWYSLGAFSGIFAVFFFCLFLSSFNYKFFVLRKLGQASLVIMIYQIIGMGFFPRFIVSLFKLDLFLWKPEFWAVRILISLAVAVLIDFIILKSQILKNIYYYSGNKSQTVSEDVELKSISTKPNMQILVD